MTTVKVPVHILQDLTTAVRLERARGTCLGEGTLIPEGLTRALQDTRTSQAVAAEILERAGQGHRA